MITKPPSFVNGAPLLFCAPKVLPSRSSASPLSAAAAHPGGFCGI